MFPLFEILVGVALFKIALPPLIDNLKSETSKSPFPLLALKTVSEKETTILVLSLDGATAVIVGANLSFNVLEFPA